MAKQLLGMIGQGLNMAQNVGNALGIGAKARDRRQLEQQGKLTEQQVKAQKEMGEHQKKLQMEMWNETNYGAQVEHLKDAGLNPALLYGMSAGSGATAGAGGTGAAGGGQAANAAQDQAAQAQMGMMIAQRELITAQAEKTKAETEKIEGVDTEKTKAETNLANINTAFQEIQTKVAGETTEAAIRAIEEEAKRLEAVAVQEENNAIISNKTFDDRVMQIKQEAIGAMLENEVKKSNVSVNEERIKQIAAEITQRWEQLRLQEKGIEASLTNMEKMTEAMLWGAGIQATGNLVNGIMNVATRGVTKAGGK